MREALASGELGYCAVRTLAPVATAEDEAEWIDRARGRTVREVEEMVRGEERPQRRREMLDLTAEADGMLREVRRVIEEELGETLDDSRFVEIVAERALNGGAGTAPRTQIAMSVCSRCEKAEMDAAGTVIRVPADVIAMACCDAVHVHGDGSVSRDIPAPLRRQVEIRDHHRCCVPGCRATAYLHIHHIQWRSEGGVHVLDNLMLVCGAHHRAIHERKLIVCDRFTFAHGDGTPYGQETLAAAIAELRRRGIADPVPIVDFVASQLGDVPFSAFVDGCEALECPHPPR